MNPSVLKKRLKQFKIHPKKSLGQNFLINQNLCKDIVSFVQDLNPQKIIEVGPGLGSLTDGLIKLEIPLELIELDHELCEFWKKNGLQVFEMDVLKISKKQEEVIFDKPCSLVGNLSYQVAARLIIEATLRWPQVEGMVFMMQKEVAQRVMSPHGKKSFSLISVMVQNYWSAQLKRTARTIDFYPRPQVEGQVIVFNRKPRPLIHHEKFLKFVKFCFAQRRKFLKTRLKKEFNQDIQKIFDHLGISHRARPEEISPQTFIELYKMMNPYNNTS